MNIVEMLDITYKEDIISNLLVGAINKSKIFRKNFLENLLGIQSIDLYDIKGYTRIVTSMGIPDIVISLKGSSDNKYLARRNEVKSKIHEEIQKIDNPNIKGFNGSNQIAKVELKITPDTTVEEFISMLNKHINMVGKIVDDVL